MLNHSTTDSGIPARVSQLEDWYKLKSKEDVALLVAEASEMFERTACVPDVDGKKVPAETIVPHAKQYILETIDNPKAGYDTELWHSPGYTLVLSWLSQKWLKKCQKFAPSVIKNVDRDLLKEQQKMCLDWAADGLIRDIEAIRTKISWRRQTLN